MIELMAGSAQNYEFMSDKRKSLVIQQNAGYRNYMTPASVDSSSVEY